MKLNVSNISLQTVTNRVVLFKQVDLCSYSNMTWIHIKNEVYQPCIRDCSIIKRSQMYFMQVYFTYDKFSFNKNSLVDIILHINIRTCWSVTETFQC